MKRHLKKITTVILALVMVLIIVPLTIIAEEGSEPEYEYQPGDNIYATAAFSSVSADATVNADNTVSIDTNGSNLYVNFFTEISPYTKADTQYKVTYTIETESVTGTPMVYIASSQEDPQIKTERKVPISETGTVSGSFSYTTAADISGATTLLRSFVLCDSDQALECTITINVVEIAPITVTIGSSTFKVGGGSSFTIPAEMDFDDVIFSGATYAVSGTATNADDSPKTVALTAEGVAVDLQALFTETLEAGTFYTLHCGDLYDISFIKPVASEITSIYIGTNESISYIHASKSNETGGSIVIVDADGNTVNSDFNLKKIKGRGNSSWGGSGAKKPYNITLDKKCEIIPGAGKSKKWCLLTDTAGSSYCVGSGFTCLATFELYQRIGGDAALSMMPVHLYINGDYRGVYMIVEKVEIDKERIDITESEYDFEDEVGQTKVDATTDPEDKAILAGIQEYFYATDSVLADGTTTGGFLVEKDQYYDEVCKFKTSRGHYYQLKAPEFATKEQVQRIAIHVQKIENAFFADDGYVDGTYYTDLIDLDSFVKKVMLEAAARNYEFWNKSSYFFVDVDAEGNFTKMKAGPAWDYDWCDYGNDTISYPYINLDYGNQLFQHGDFAARFAELSETLLKGAWEDEIEAVTAYLPALTAAYEKNTARWGETMSEKTERAADLEGFAGRFSTRYTTWYENIMVDTSLLGVTISDSDGTLTATVSGTGTVQWKKLNADGTFTNVGVAGSETFAPTDSGTYYAVATGEKIGGINSSPMYSNPIVFFDASITPREATLSLGDLTYINIKIDFEGIDAQYIRDHGGMYYWLDGTTAPADYVAASTAENVILISGASNWCIDANGRLFIQTEGLAGKQYADSYHIVYYVELEDGSYIYSNDVTYSVRRFCEYKLGITNPAAVTSDNNLYNLCLAMLDYGTMCQYQFAHNTADLANKNITPEIRTTGFKTPVTKED